MAKKIIAKVKLQIPAGQANPTPPVGPALGQHGVNIMEFCKAYNAMTQSQMGTIVPVEITIFEDRSFSFITKTPPAAVLLKQKAGIEKGSKEPHRNKENNHRNNGDYLLILVTAGPRRSKTELHKTISFVLIRADNATREPTASRPPPACLATFSGGSI